MKNYFTGKAELFYSSKSLLSKLCANCQCIVGPIDPLSTSEG